MSRPHPPRLLPTWRTVARSLTAVAFLVTGTLHFTHGQTFRAIVPLGFPLPGLLVMVSGVAEMAGGLGLLWWRLRRWAAWGLMALLLAVFPANVYMALRPDLFPGIPVWALWLRLPLQPALVWWVWWVSGGEPPRTGAPQAETL
jgi:uncharacterized membrane protein